jgi:hypothetical protein
MSAESGFLAVVANQIVHHEEPINSYTIMGVKNLDHPSRTQTIGESVIQRYLEKPTRFSLSLGNMGTLEPIDETMGHWVSGMLESDKRRLQLVRGKITDNPNLKVERLDDKDYLPLLGVIYNGKSGFWRGKNREAKPATVHLYFFSRIILSMLEDKAMRTT